MNWGTPTLATAYWTRFQPHPFGDTSDDDTVVSSPAQICPVSPISHNLFNSVRHLFVNDRAIVTEERRKNLGLMACISSLGHYVQDVNSFLRNDGINTAKLVNDFVTNVPILTSRPTVRRIASSTIEIESPNSLGLGQLSDSVNGCVGKPLLADKATENLEPMNFARICVEITSSSALPSSLELVMFDEETNSKKAVVVKVEYQNKPQTYSHCKSFGHSFLKCPSANFKWVPVAKANDLSKVHLPESNASTAPSAPKIADSDSDSPVPHLIDSDHSWTLVSKGSKKLSPPPCDDLENTAGHVISHPPDIVSSARPAPLVDKLGLNIDKNDIEGPSQNSNKKKNKGRGGLKPIC